MPACLPVRPPCRAPSPYGMCCGCAAEPRWPQHSCAFRGLPAEIKGAVRQLKARARIMVYALATANAPLLAAHGPLQVEGTVEVAGKAPSPDQHKQWAGNQWEVGCAAAPETAQLSMKLRVLP